MVLAVIRGIKAALILRVSALMRGVKVQGCYKAGC